MYLILRPSASLLELECEHLRYGSCAWITDKEHILAVHRLALNNVTVAKTNDAPTRMLLKNLSIERGILRPTSPHKRHGRMCKGQLQYENEGCDVIRNQ